MSKMYFYRLKDPITHQYLEFADENVDSDESYLKYSKFGSILRNALELYKRHYKRISYLKKRIKNNRALMNSYIQYRNSPKSPYITEKTILKEENCLKELESLIVEPFEPVIMADGCFANIIKDAKMLDLYDHLEERLESKWSCYNIISAFKDFENPKFNKQDFKYLILIKNLGINAKQIIKELGIQYILFTNDGGMRDTPVIAVNEEYKNFLVLARSDIIHQVFRIEEIQKLKEDLMKELKIE